ncbi:MAG TPA: hypothetical protein VJJ76_02195 [archaeon]|nr:hypothetical protein [archaeon]
MADIGLITIAGSPLEVLIPVWFYIFSGLAYFASAAVSLAVSYYSFRLYRTSKSKKFAMLSVVFAVLGVAYLALTLSSVYTYYYQSYFREELGISLNVFNRQAFNFYYVTSLLSYVLLFVTYFPKNTGKRFHLLYVPLWFSSLTDFHIASLFLLAFVVARAAHNFYKFKSTNTFLVLAAFALMAVFHVAILLLPFDLTYYLLSHALLAAGFVSLLIMLIRVNRIGRR